MSNIDAMLEINSANQDLFVDLNERDSETISGGALERFTITNRTNARIPYTVDRKRTPRQNPNSVVRWTTGRGGIVAFDYDVRRPGLQLRRYNLSNNRQYVFRPDRSTPYQGDVNLYRIA